MRRALSLTLFVLLLLPLLAPLFASAAEAQSGVPACCRRDGKHHCMMGEVVAADAQRRLQSPREVCPYQQRVLTASHHERTSATARAEAPDVMLQEPAASARAECMRRISFDRSRQKRGPPTLV